MTTGNPQGQGNVATGAGAYDGLQVGCELTRGEAAASGTSAAKARRQKEGIGMRAARGRGYFENRRLDNIYSSAHRAM